MINAIAPALVSLRQGNPASSDPVKQFRITTITAVPGLVTARFMLLAELLQNSNCAGLRRSIESERDFHILFYVRTSMQHILLMQSKSFIRGDEQLRRLTTPCLLRPFRFRG
jgi:hypothetical protein